MRKKIKPQHVYTHGHERVNNKTNNRTNKQYDKQLDTATARANVATALNYNQTLINL